MSFSKIVGTGSHLPERVVTNHELEALVETSDDWIRERTGISERRIIGENESTIDLAYPAAKKALEAANWNADEVDLIVVGTTTPDKIYPSTACRLQAKLGVTKGFAFDVQAVCSGFVYALSVADQYVKSGVASKALVVGADTHSRLLDWSDRKTCVLFGDGGGAVALESSHEAGIIDAHLGADGSYEHLLYVEGGIPLGEGRVTEGGAKTKMRGNEVFKFAVRKMGKAALEILSKNGYDRHDVDWLIPHQANIRIIESMAKALKMPMDKVIVTVQKHGNTSAGSIPLALDTAVKDGSLQPGQLIMLEAFGGGFTWGSILLRW